MTGLGDDDHPQYLHIAANRTVTAQHSFSPVSTTPPFLLGVNAQGELVTGLNADQVDGEEASELAKSQAGDGLLISGRILRLDTPGQLSVSSSNDPAGSHTHAITASNNPGAATSLLKTNGSGLLQIEGLGVGASPQTGNIITGASARIGPSSSHNITFNDTSRRLKLESHLRLQNDGVNVDFDTDTGGSLFIEAPGDISINAEGKDVHPKDAYDLNLGTLPKKWLTIHAAELWVETLVAHDTIATIGGRILVIPTTELIAVLLKGASTVDVLHNQMANNDRVYMEADGKVEFMFIDGGDTPITGGFRYNIVRDLDGSGANEWQAGAAMVNMGQTDDGWIDLYSVQGVAAGSTTGPTIVMNVRNSLTYNDWSERAAFGNLDGLYGVSTDKYGVGIGRFDNGYNNMLITAEDGIEMRYRNGGLNITVGKWEPGGDFILGQVSLNKSNMFWDQSAGRLNFRGGINGTVVEAYIDTDGSIIAGGGTLQLDSTGINITADSSDWFALDAYRFTNDGSTLISSLEAYESGTTNNLRLKTAPMSSGPSDLTILAEGFENSQLDLKVINTTDGANRTITLTVGGVSLPEVEAFETYITPTLHVGHLLSNDLNTKMTRGVTISQWTADDEIFALKSDDVGHGMTDFTETDTFLMMQKISATKGGVDFFGLTEDVVAIGMDAAVTNTNTTTGTGGLGAFQINVQIKSGSGGAALGANKNLFVIRNFGSTQFIVKGDGDYHYNGAGSSFDGEDDPALLRALTLAAGAPGMVRSAYDDLIEYNQADLERLGIATFPEDGGHFVNGGALNRLLIGATHQLWTKIIELQEQITLLQNKINN